MAGKISFSDMLKKAKAKGIEVKENTYAFPIPKNRLTKSWKSESTLFQDVPLKETALMVCEAETPLLSSQNQTENNLGINAQVQRMKEHLVNQVPDFNQNGELHTDRTKGVEKLEPNLSQSRAQLEPNISQTKAKVEPNLGQVKPKLSQTRAKVEPKLEPKVRPNLSQESSIITQNNLSQTEAKVEPNREFSLLAGLQKQITIFIYDECQSALAEETPGLTIDYIAMYCNTTKSAARKALQRLENKKIIVRSDFKNGRGGWTRYKLPTVIYQEIHRLKSLNKLEPNLSQVEVKRTLNLSQSRAQLEPKLEPKLEPNVSSSSSNINNINTTTSLPDEWTFDISEYEKFGFTKSHLIQLFRRGVITAFDIEQSLVQFDFDLKNNSLPKIKTSAMNYLMGLFHKGNTHNSEAYQKYTNEIAKEMKQRYEEQKKIKQEYEILSWYEGLNEIDKKNLEDKIEPISLKIRYETYGIFDNEVFPWILGYYNNKKNN